MLTLLEPPRSQRTQAQANRSDQHLLQLAPDEEEFFDAADYEPPNEMRNTSGGWLTSGKATGKQWALYSRSFIQKIIFSLGNCVNGNAWKVILTVATIFSLCLYGLQFVRIETEIVKLWVAKGGRLDAELNFLPELQKLYNNSEGHEMVRENGLGGGYQVIIQTPEYQGQNALLLEALLKHVDIMKESRQFPSRNPLKGRWARYGGTHKNRARWFTCPYCKKRVSPHKKTCKRCRKQYRIPSEKRIWSIIKRRIPRTMVQTNY